MALDILVSLISGAAGGALVWVYVFRRTPKSGPTSIIRAPFGKKSPKVLSNSDKTAWMRENGRES